MNFLTDSIRPIYFKYLTAAFGSALISSIYGVVDAAMVGRRHGPAGGGGASVEHHLRLGLLTGIGGSVLFSPLGSPSGRAVTEGD